jgi:hypothetical protein
VKAFLNPYNRMGDYIYYLAHYMFAAMCRTDKVKHFTKFIAIVANMDWGTTPPLHRSHVTVTTLHTSVNNHNWLKLQTTVPHPKGVPELQQL